MQRIRRSLILMFMLIVGVQPTHGYAQTERRCFDVPGITDCIEGRFREFWEQNGGLPVFGYPISAALQQQTAEGVFLTQYFERNRFEAHPENARPYDVLLGRLGVDALMKQNRDWTTFPRAASSIPHFFTETGHAIGHEPFWDYWSTHGLEFDGKAGTSFQESLALFGLPLSEPQQERNSSGDTVVTQWFERARFEDHGSKGVLLGLLGNETSAISTEDRFSANYLGAQERGGVRIEIARVLFTRKYVYANEFTAGAWADIDVIGMITFRVTNLTQQTLTVYPTFGSVVINGEQIELIKWTFFDYGDVDGDILPGATKLGGLYFGIRRSTVPQITHMQLAIDAPVDSSYHKQGEDYYFDIDLSKHEWVPLPPELD